jgi:hypothetical protein
MSWGPRMLSLALQRGGARLRAACVFLRARPRVFAGRLVAPASVAAGRCVRSTSALRDYPTRTLVRRRFPAQRTRSRRGLSVHTRGSLSYRGLRLVLVRASSECAPLLSSGDEKSEQWEARGRPLRTRPGGVTLHGATPTSAGVGCTQGGVFFRRAVTLGPPLASLSPPPSVCAISREIRAHGAKAAKTGSAGPS